MNSKQQGARKGFTLIELLVVIAIIGLLASIILASLDSARKKGRDARRIADMKQLQLALELYYDANSSFPAVATAIAAPNGTTPASAVNMSTVATAVSPNYISSVPTDPSSSAGYYYQYASLKADNTACTATPCPNYVIITALESSNSTPAQSGWSGTADGVANLCVNNSASAPYEYCVHN